MTFRGHFKNGSVVLDEPADVADGTEVEVAVRGGDASSLTLPKAGSVDAMRLLHGIAWAGDGDELKRLAAEVQEMREDDLRLYGDRHDRSILDGLHPEHGL